MTAISLSPFLLIVALFVVVPTLVVLWLAFDAIKRKNWGGLAALAFAASALLLGGSLAVWSTAQRIVNDFGGVPELEFLPAQTLVTAPTPPQPPTARVVSDEELAAVASAQPKIKLEEMSVPVEVVDVQVNEENATDDAADVKQDHPEWIDAHLGDNQKLIVSGPFTTKESCEADTQKQLTEWLEKRYWGGVDASLGARIDMSQVIKSQHDTIRETSVGEMHFLYTLAEVTPEVEAQIAKSLADAAAQVARKRGVRAVSFAGAGVLSLVALTHIMLRSGGRKATNKPTN